MAKVILKTPKLDKINKEIKYLQKHGIKVGVFGEKAEEEDESGVKVIDYAIPLEYGTVFMPERPFFRKATQTRKSKRLILEEEKEILKDVFLGNLTGKQALLQLGIFIEQRIKDQILSNDFVPLKESTKKKKKRNKNNILRENDRMLDAVFFEIIKI